MSYVNARDIFPDEILKMVQFYLDGEYIYIPKKEENKKAWLISSFSYRSSY